MIISWNGYLRLYQLAVVIIRFYPSSKPPTSAEHVSLYPEPACGNQKCRIISVGDWM